MENAPYNEVEEFNDLSALEALYYYAVPEREPG
jgi:hypothetical protein